MPAAKSEDVSASVKSPARRFYRPELDALRLLAFVLVFCRHAPGPVEGAWGAVRLSGEFGVCLFFLLSSYLITELLEQEDTRTRRIDLKAFYVRRVLRIWPLYFAALAADFAFQHLSHHAFPIGQLAAYMFLMGNVYLASHPSVYTLSFPLWSISVEEQFYILWPSVRKFLGRRGSYAFSLGMLAGSYATLLWFGERYAGQAVPVNLNSIVEFSFFAIGALLALVLRGGAPVLPLLVRGSVFAGGLVSLALAVLTLRANDSLMNGYILLTWALVNLGCVLLFLSFLGEPRLGGWKAIRYLGKISYGLYVFHWPALRIATAAGGRVRLAPNALAAFDFLLALILTVVAAAASYRLFESPILRYKQRFEVVRTRSV